jgi:hypothetical protein
MWAAVRAALRARPDLRLRTPLRRAKGTEAEAEAGGKRSQIKFDIGGTKQTFDIIDVQPEANRYYNSFHSVKGAARVGRLWITASVVAFCYQLAPHTATCRDWVRACYQSYTKGVETKVSAEMVGLVREVLGDMGLQGATAEEAASAELFVLTLEEPCGWGEPGSLMLGYPQSFHYTRPHDVPLDRMRFGGGWARGESLGRSSMELPEARHFCESMVLGREARKFGVAREVAARQAFSQYQLGAVSASWVLLTYNLARNVNKRLGLFDKRRPPVFRLMLYLGLLPTMTYSYLLMRDLLGRRAERAAVGAAAALGPDYRAGGVAYYDQLLLRNRCLRRLQPQAGLYTPEGELLPGLLRTKRAPLMQLRELCTSQQPQE